MDISKWQSVCINIGPFSLFIPNRATPVNTLGLLQAVLFASPGQEDGQVMVHLCAALNPLAGGRLMERTAKPQCDYVVEVVRKSGKFDLTLLCGAEVLVSGTLSELDSWLDSMSQLGRYLGKVVHFNYDGGSNPGKRRFVRVEKVSCGPGGRFLEGYDLEKPNLNESYRKYDLNKLKSEITLLN